ncbi:ROK family protein [Anaerocolumna xylanovorans]|uniref:Glucokinase n=1 Tax=Anaerocolumna xylanovorans DSM 12503 TaxID=1121345 RepID=A0A1M7XZL7_9FIRM|nr:ROK family protein [Anaerocolumna xylanovorans]SHO44666.1 glucokinase [Anaerocolumna xylanovorans DSM 12503]
MTSITVDLGGTRIKLALINNGEILESHILPAQAEVGIQNRIQDIEKIIRRWLRSSSEIVEGIGIAFPGIVNPIEKRVISISGKYYDAVDFDFTNWCNKNFNLPLVLENDANAALLGEVYYGCAKGYKDAVIMILGTGVGTAAMMEGKVLHGKHFQAGCLGGHFAVSLSDRPCSCGGKGCLEANASTWALPLIAQEQPDFDQSGLSTEEKIDFVALKKWVLRGDETAIRLLAQFNHYWSLGIKNLIHAYDPEVVILSGGVIKCGDIILKPLTEKVSKNAWTPWGEVTIKAAKNPEHSVSLGLHHLITAERKDYNEV